MERYEPISVLGYGSFAMVIRARERHTGKDVAIKHFTIKRGDKTAYFSELKMIMRLDHPHIVQCVDLFDASTDSSDLIFEFADRGSLRERLPGAVPFPADQSLQIMVQVARGLAHAHRNHIIHRDIKPENILIFGRSHRELYKITDFGVAKFIGLTNKAMTSIGSPGYMAPEQFYDEYDLKSDIYALGILLFELLHGDVPFSGSPVDVFKGHLEGEIPFADHIHPRLVELVSSMAAKKAVERPSAEELVTRLEEVCAALDVDIPALGEAIEDLSSSQAEIITGASGRVSFVKPGDLFEHAFATAAPTGDAVDQPTEQTAPGEHAIHTDATVDLEPQEVPVEQPEAREPSHAADAQTSAEVAQTSAEVVEEAPEEGVEEKAAADAAGTDSAAPGETADSDPSEETAIEEEPEGVAPAALAETDNQVEHFAIEPEPGVALPEQPTEALAEGAPAIVGTDEEADAVDRVDAEGAQESPDVAEPVEEISGEPDADEEPDPVFEVDEETGEEDAGFAEAGEGEEELGLLDEAPSDPEPEPEAEPEPAPASAGPLSAPADDDDDGDPFSFFDSSPSFDPSTVPDSPVSAEPESSPVAVGQRDDSESGQDIASLGEEVAPAALPAADASAEAVAQLREDFFGEGFEDAVPADLYVPESLKELDVSESSSVGALRISKLWSRTTDTGARRLLNLDDGRDMLLIGTKGINEVKSNGSPGKRLFETAPDTVGLPSHGALPLICNNTILVMSDHEMTDKAWELEAEIDQLAVAHDLSAVALMIGHNVCFHDADGNQLWTARLDHEAGGFFISFDEENALMIVSLDSDDHAVHFYNSEGTQVESHWLPGRIVAATRSRAAAGAWVLVRLRMCYQFFRVARQGIRGYCKTQREFRDLVGAQSWIVARDGDETLWVIDPIRGDESPVHVEGDVLDYELGTNNDQLYLLERRGEILKYLTAFEMKSREQDDAETSQP